MRNGGPLVGDYYLKYGRWTETTKRIEAQMKEAHKLLDDNVIAHPSYHSAQAKALAGGEGGDWVSELPVGTTFIASAGADYLNEFTIEGKYRDEKGLVIAIHLRENRLLSGMNSNHHDWYSPRAFCKKFDKIGILNE